MTLTFQARRSRRNMQNILYRLRRTFRCEASLYFESEATKEPNLETGEVPAASRSVIKLRNFISFDETARRRFEYDLSFIAANKNFTYGGIFESGDRIGLLQYVDTGEDFVLTDDHYFVFDNTKFRPFKYVKLDHHLGYLIHMRRVQTELFSQIHQHTLEHTLILEQDIDSD